MSNHFYPLILLFLFSYNVGWSQNVTFRKQIEVDTFDTSITTISGSITIRSDVTDLTNLSNITTVEGGLSVNDTEGLENLDGLNNISSFGTSVSITNNKSLQNINALKGITTLTHGIRISNNRLLQNLDGLENINAIPTFIWIEDNSVLQNINGLRNITSIDGVLRIESNPKIQNLIGLENITSINRSVDILSNNELLNLDGLENIISMKEDFTIEDNNKLQNIEGLENLTFIGGIFEIIENTNLTNLNGLENLDVIESHLYITRNDSLENINSLSKISTIGGVLSILTNPKLQHLANFENLTSVGSLYIDGNVVLQSLDGLENITSIRGILKIASNFELLNINGLRNVSYVSNDVDISANRALQRLSGLNLKGDIQGNFRLTGNFVLQNLKELENITGVEGDLTIRGNNVLENLKGLESIVSIGGELSISSNDGLLNLGGLVNLSSIGTNLIIEENSKLKTLNSLVGITSIPGEIDISYNISLVDINGLRNLSTVGGDFILLRNDALLNIMGLEKLSSVGGFARFWENDELINLEGLENLTSVGGELYVVGNDGLINLKGLENLTSVGEDCKIWQNDKLSICCDIEFLIANPNVVGGIISISLNSEGCNTVEEVVSFGCDDVSSIKGCMYWDENQNGTKDIDERSIRDLSTATLPIDIISYTDIDGCYATYLENGNYNINYIPSPLWQLTSDSTTYNIIVNDDSHDNLDFGFTPVDSTLAGRHSSISGIPRCFREVIFDFNFKNEGNTIIDGRLYVELDSFTELASFIQPADSIISDKIWEWHYEDLYPGELLQRRAILQLPSFEVDSILIFSAASAKTEFHPEIFFKSNYHTPILCAYDPNDKLVSPDREGDENYTLFDEALTYTVRFQNTGNDTAFTVVIRDTLDAFLDASTLSVLASSHRNVLSSEMKENKFLTFTFEDILLPDSTVNFNGSQGYITYTIQPMEDLDENSIIENSASIYFDFNPPILTNTTQNTMVSCLPYKETIVEATLQLGGSYTLPDGIVVSEAGSYTSEILDEEGCPIEVVITILDILNNTDNSSLLESFLIQPNPTQSYFYLDIQTQAKINHSLVVTNIHGQVVFSESILQQTTRVDILDLASGIYFVQLSNENGKVLTVEKLMVGE